MANKKQAYTIIAKEWLENFLKEKYSKDFSIEVILPKSNISKLSDQKIKSVENYTLFDFKPDVLGILTNKKTKKVELVLLNRSTSAISVKEIGEINVYSLILTPLHSFIVSPKGLPTEVNTLLLNESIEDSLLNYNKEKEIIILKLLENGKIDNKNIFPRRFKNYF
ncbi:MAG: hypothetical protein KKB88_04440 [Nanoarchaeota archaeon]|nr:hypothetical protein [Nanoarchaeota archaeon]